MVYNPNDPHIEGSGRLTARNEITMYEIDYCNCSILFIMWRLFVSLYPMTRLSLH